MHVHVITLELHLPGCSSLKEKRSRLKPLLAALHQNFNVSAAEIEHQDAHRSAVIACAVVSNSDKHGNRVLSGIPDWIEHRFADLQLVDDHLSHW
ncbi:MAG: DUF503 domain-containing protein [Acidobacteriota bacterium]